MSDANIDHSKKHPAYTAFHVREGNDRKFWTRIGVAWKHKDGKGFDVQLDGLARSTAASSSASRPTRNNPRSNRAGRRARPHAKGIKL